MIARPRVLTVLTSGLCCCLLALQIAAAEPLSGFGAIGIAASSVGFSRMQTAAEKFGRLVYRGGLVLTSPDADFGGLSGLGISSDGTRILAISDRGHMFSAHLSYSGGRLTGLGGGAKSSLKGSRGQPLPDEKKSWHDAEGLALGPRRLGGPLWVSFERHHRIETYDFGRLGAAAPAKRTRLPSPLNHARRNSGVEGLARFGPGSAYEGALLAFTEHPDAKGKIPGHILGGPKPGPVWLKAPGGYSATGLAFHPNGDLLVLERRFGNLFDFSVRIRRISAATIHPHAHLAGEILFEGGLAYMIDNLEGIAVHTHESGEVRLTVVSDDNFSPIQQTLLLQFAIAD